MFLNTNRSNLTNYYSCRSCSYNYTWIRDKTRYLFLCQAHQSEKRFSAAQPSHSFFDSREPLLPPKRASFFQKWEKWHFLLEKVCHVVNPRYLCIWKRTRGEATILWIVAIAKRRTRLILVFPECFPLFLRFRRRRKAQGNAAAETLHKQEVFDIFAYWFFLNTQWVVSLREFGIIIKRECNHK